MKFFIDADLPKSMVQVLSAAGHDSIDVRDIRLGSASDRVIFDTAQREGAVLITRDLDFTNPLLFPETSHHGIIIVRIRETMRPSFVNQALRSTIAKLREDEFANSVIIVEESRFRRRTL
jgi:predicted nuclease of predicted toxin-antitoxin system